jgi:hypothetical protein
VTALPHLGLYRRVTALALIVAPALFLVDNLIHPEEFTRGHEAQQLAEIADAYTRWQLAHFIGFVAILGLAVAVLGLAFLVRRRQPRLGLAGGALGVAGLMGLSAVIALDGFAWGVLGEVWARTQDKQAVEVALHDLQQSEWSMQFYGLVPAWVAGMVMLALGAARQGSVPLWAGGLLALGALAVGLEGAIQDNAYFIASAAIQAVGGAAVGASLLRLEDGEFAGERRTGPRAAGEAPLPPPD